MLYKIFCAGEFPIDKCPPISYTKSAFCIEDGLRARRALNGDRKRVSPHLCHHPVLNDHSILALNWSLSDFISVASTETIAFWHWAHLALNNTLVVQGMSEAHHGNSLHVLHACPNLSTFDIVEM